MERDELFDKLELDNPGDFQYYEQFAELLECEGHIRFEDFAEALSGAKPEDLGEFAENYTEELMNSLPDDAEEAYTKLSAIQQRLMLLAEGIENSGAMPFAEELYRFREWYTDWGSVFVDGKPTVPMEAIFSCRADRLTREKHEYNLSGFAEYRIEELSMGIGNFEKIDTEGGEA